MYELVFVPLDGSIDRDISGHVSEFIQFTYIAVIPIAQRALKI